MAQPISKKRADALGEPATSRPGFAARAVQSVLLGLRASLGTIWFLLRVVIPVSLCVALLDWLGVLGWASRLLEPLMALIGLPGEAALAFISAMLLNIYAAIAVASSMALSLKAATILALMCLTAHNLIVETAVMKKTGSSAAKMLVLRIGAALAAGFVLNLIIPAGDAAPALASDALAAPRPSFAPMLGSWAFSTALLALKIALIVIAVMVGQKLLWEFRILTVLSRLFAPLMRLFGLPRDSSYLWIVVNVVGYSYGAGVVTEQVSSGGMKKQEADLFNHHAALCHSLVEDTALYLAVGIPLFWITVPRLAMAALVPWLERARRHLFRYSFRAGTI